MDDSQYYRGESSGWSYKGGPVLSKSRILADSAEAMVETRVSDSCVPDTSASCPDGHV